jgi:hypothetical protein
MKVNKTHTHTRTPVDVLHEGVELVLIQSIDGLLDVGGLTRGQRVHNQLQALILP